MSRALKVTGNCVLYDVWLRCMRVIMSSSRALYCLPSVKKQKPDFKFSVQCVIKQLLDSVFADIQNNRGLGKGYSYLDLYYSGYHEDLPAFQQTIAPSRGQGGQKHSKCMKMSTPTSLWCYCSYALKWNTCNWIPTWFSGQLRALKWSSSQCFLQFSKRMKNATDVLAQKNFEFLKDIFNTEICYILGLHVTSSFSKIRN